MSILRVHIEEAGYEREKATIHQINFDIEKNELVGMIGANGAGKSTTIKGILGQLSYIKGEISEINEIRYSYVPERPIFYDELTLWEHIEFISTVEKLEQRDIVDMEQLLRKFKLTKHIHQFPNTFSKGMQQKAMIALALLTKPELLIVDEPFIGLDPNATKLLLHLLNIEKQKGTSILLCTHVLDTAQRICDRFLIIEKGTLKASGTLGEVLSQCGAEEQDLYACIAMEEEEDE